MLRSLLKTQTTPRVFQSAVIARPQLTQLPQLPQLPQQLTQLRLNSTSTPPKAPEAQQEKQKSASDVEAEEWLSAIRQIRERYVNEGIPHFGSPQMTQLSNKKFEPTEEQLSKWESLQDKPIPEKIHPLVQHCTNMIMKDGKKARAQRVMARALYLVQLQLRLDPVDVLEETLDKMAPLMQLKTYKTRVAKNLTVPVPLNKRQRDRRAFQWIVEGSEKRRSKAFAVRLGEEIISAYEGKSSGYEKRLQMHKAAMLHRAYVKLR